MRTKLILLFIVSLLVIDFFEAPEAHARRRRLFGGRARRPVVRRNVNRNRNVARNQPNVARNQSVDRDLFSRFAIDPTTSLIVDPTGSLGFFGSGGTFINDPNFFDPSGLGLQRFRSAPRFARSRNGQVFEVAGGANLEVVQPVIFSRGQIVGGELGSFGSEAELQRQFLNQTGDFTVVP